MRKKLHSDGNAKRSAKILRVITDCSYWQRNLFILLFLLDIIGGWHSYAITFLAPNADYWCTQAKDSSGSVIELKWTNATFQNETIIVYSEHCDLTVKTLNTTTETQYPCTKWKYDITEYPKTIVNEWDLVCEREWLVSLAKSIYMVGFMASVFIFGQFSDRFGRWLTIMICYLITCVSGLLCAFSSSYVMFIISRFFQAFGRTGLTTTGYVLLMEMVSPKNRLKIGIGIQFGFSLGIITLAVMAYFIRNWYWLQLAISLPVIPFICLYWLVPESPSWLITHGKWEELEKLFLKAVRINKKGVTDAESTKVLYPKINDENKQRKTNILDLFQTPLIRKRMFIMSYLWIVNAFVSYGVSYNTNDLWGDPYINLILLGLVKLPSLAVVFYGMEYLGRRLTLVAAMLIGGITYMACAIAVEIQQSPPWLITTLALFGQFCINGAFSILYLYTVELFPTVIRNSALGTCSTIARIGAIVAPFVKELEKVTYPSVPHTIYTITAISSGIFALFLPETSNKKIANTLEEEESLYTSTKPKQYMQISNSIPENDESEEE